MQGMSAEQYMYLQSQGGENKQKPFKEAEAEEGVVPRKTDSKEEDNFHSEVHGNPEEQEEEDKDLTRAQM